MRRPSRRIRETVYVVGAGFSAGLGYPLTKNLLHEIWSHLDSGSQDDLSKVVQFHHPAFDAARPNTFPDIEQLLSEISVNLSLFGASRPAEGTFKRSKLESVETNLLLTIASRFHELFRPAIETGWLSDMKERILTQDAAIISFNWDLILDHLLFGKNVDDTSYGLRDNRGAGPVLLKPHGSLNWYDAETVRKVPTQKRIRIFTPEYADGGQSIEAFRRPREIKSGTAVRYRPLIVPPTYLKNFRDQIFQSLWRRCTDVLSTAKKLFFLGYSLPPADLHAQFILRCGFHNQIEGRLNATGRRLKATGPAAVVIVNPDQGAARRIESVAGPRIPCEWVPSRVEDWLLATTA